MAGRLDGPWPVPAADIRAELVSYLAAASDPSVWEMPTLCPAWTVRQVTMHLAATFDRFGHQLTKSRSGDLTPPFGRDELTAENLRAVAAFSGDPEESLRESVGRFLGMIGSAGDLIGHQRGPIPVGLQALFGLNELAVHHHDLPAATGHRYRPGDHAVALLVSMADEVFGLPKGVDPWDRLLRHTGRPGTGPKAG
jgi:uncharacterized protein (TIGR03083 family)